MITHKLLYSEVLKKKYFSFCHIQEVGQHYYRGLRSLLLETVRLRKAHTEGGTYVDGV